MPIHPELRALDEELAPFGGAARAIMDDAYAIGPPEVVFPALERGNEARRYSLRYRYAAHSSPCRLTAAES